MEHRNIFKNDNKLFKPYIKHILLIIVLPLLLLYSILAMFFVSQNRNEKKIYSLSLMQNKAAVIDNLFTHIHQYYENCINDIDITMLLTKPISINNLSSPTASENAGADAKNMHNFFSSIDSVYLYSKSNNYVFGLYGRNSSNTFERFHKTEWYSEYINNGKQNYVKKINYDNKDYITFLYNIGSSQHSGILVIEVSVEELLNQLNVSSDTDNNISENIVLEYNLTGENLINHTNGKKGTMYSQELNNFPATLYYSVSNPGTTAFSQTARSVTFVLFIITSMAITILLAFLFSKRDYSVVSSVLTEIESTHINNDLNYEDMKYVDIASENISFDNDFKDKLITRITDLKKSQLIALQSQINPHFITNTLNMISSTIMVNNKADTDSIYMIQHLSKILNYALRIKDYIVTIKDEISSLKSYITILNLRLGNMFDTSWEVDEELTETRTIKSLIQPLVENSIEHGIQKLRNKRHGLLSIRITSENDILYITVTDNGVGFGAEKLAEITGQLDSNTVFQNDHIGLKNVVTRIRLLFGEKGGYSISSDTESTSVTIYHPIIR